MGLRISVKLPLGRDFKKMTADIGMLRNMFITCHKLAE